MKKEQIYKKLNEVEILAGSCRENYFLYNAFGNERIIDQFNKDFMRLQEMIQELNLLLKTDTKASNQ